MAVEVWYEFEIDVPYGVGYEYVAELSADLELPLPVGGEPYVAVSAEVGDGCQAGGVLAAGEGAEFSRLLCEGTVKDMTGGSKEDGLRGSRSCSRDWTGDSPAIGGMVPGVASHLPEAFCT